MSDSQVTLVGNATRSPEMRYTPSGAAVVNFGLAVNRRWKGRDGEWQESVSFFDVTCWNDLANNVADTVDKGSRVIVTGRLEQRSWETKDGDRRSKVEVVADDIGVSCRFATATVQRNQRSDTTAGSGGGSSDPWSTPREPMGADPEEPFVGDPFWIWEL